MPSFSQTQMSTLASALQHAESQRMYWFESTGSHEYFVVSMQDANSTLANACAKKAKGEVGADGSLNLAVVLFNSF